MTELTEQQTAILAFERGRWKYAGAKEQAVHERFGLSLSRYLQTLDHLIDSPAALAADPPLVNRLRRLREERQRRRTRAA